MRNDIRPVTALKMIFPNIPFNGRQIFFKLLSPPLFTLFFHVFFVEITKLLSEGGTRGSGFPTLTIPNHFLAFFLPPDFDWSANFSVQPHVTGRFVFLKKEKRALAVRRALEQKKMTVPPSYKNVVVLLFHFFNTKRRQRVRPLSLRARENSPSATLNLMRTGGHGATKVKMLNDK